MLRVAAAKFKLNCFASLTVACSGAFAKPHINLKMVFPALLVNNIDEICEVE
jgi:hypothetical protein